MSGIKNFVLGFGFSLASMSFIGQLSSTNHSNAQNLPEQKIQIELFKSAEAKTAAHNFNFNTAVTKKNISSSSFQVASLHSSTDTPSEGIEDDEILSINIENIIPIELEDNSSDNNSQILNTDENDNLVAMLPSNDIQQEETSPWVITKGSQFVDNKKFVEEHNLQKNLLSDNFSQTTDDEFLSYKVAEKIKQSILFPIPDEILNDENLTPTFIKKKTNTNNREAKKEAQKKQNTKTDTTPKMENKGIISNISSWLKDNNKKENNTKKEKNTPLYSSNEAAPEKQVDKNEKQAEQTNKNREKDNFVSFYKTLQDTTTKHEKEKIIPSELKLSFRPDRAEISGQTLRWLKAFSEKTNDSKTFLQVRIDASAPIELQKKRLNLLYSIFMNNGVNPEKIDTVFSLTKPNTFIIRILTTD